MNHTLVELSTTYNYFELYRTLFRYSVSDISLFNLYFWQTNLGAQITKTNKKIIYQNVTLKKL